MSSRTRRLTRLGTRTVTVVALGAAIVIGIEAGARAEEAGSQPEEQAAPDVVASGVNIAGLHVGGMTRAEAREAAQAHAMRPILLTFEDESWRYAPTTLGARAKVKETVRAALAAPADATLPLAVAVDRKQFRRWTKKFAKRFDEERRDATIVLRDLRPDVTDSQEGRKLLRAQTRAAIRAALASNDGSPVELAVRTLEPRVTKKQVGLAIVIKRASNRLVLYKPGGRKGMRVKRKFDVATGLAAYPTPLGSYEITTMQRNPWWRPPDSDWAKGAKPIPPGPGNPLGTRWMGISAPAVGIHGTPDAASIGYSASHGCIRMRVPQAEWLFERVDVGTPVYILDA
ncbi:MAG: L,D-transpeptidase family protein [Gaiellaceae bacterium]